MERAFGSKKGPVRVFLPPAPRGWCSSAAGWLRTSPPVSHNGEPSRGCSLHPCHPSLPKAGMLWPSPRPTLMAISHGFCGVWNVCAGFPGSPAHPEPCLWHRSSLQARENARVLCGRCWPNTFHKTCKDGDAPSPHDLFQGLAALGFTECSVFELILPRYRCGPSLLLLPKISTQTPLIPLPLPAAFYVL